MHFSLLLIFTKLMFVNCTPTPHLTYPALLLISVQMSPSNRLYHFLTYYRYCPITSPPCKLCKSRVWWVLFTVVDTSELSPYPLGHSLPMNWDTGTLCCAPPWARPAGVLCSSSHLQASRAGVLGGYLPQLPQPSNESTRGVFATIPQVPQQDLSPGRPQQ